MTEEDRLAEEKRAEEKADDDIREVLKTPSGRRFYYRVIDHAGAQSETFVPGMPDVTNFNQGKRSEGRYWLAQLLKVDAKAYFQMCREYKSAMVVKEMVEQNKEK